MGFTSDFFLPSLDQINTLKLNQRKILSAVVQSLAKCQAQAKRRYFAPFSAIKTMYLVQVYLLLNLSNLLTDKWILLKIRMETSVKVRFDLITCTLYRIYTNPTSLVVFWGKQSLHISSLLFLTLFRMRGTKRPLSTIFPAVTNSCKRRNQPQKLSGFQFQLFCHTGIKLQVTTKSQSQIIGL